MISKEKIFEEVEKTLEAYDEDAILEANPFLLTRVKALQKKSVAQSRKYSFRFNLSRALLVVLLIINVVSVVYYLEINHKQSLEKKLVMQLKSDFQIDQTQNNY